MKLILASILTVALVAGALAVPAMLDGPTVNDFSAPTEQRVMESEANGKSNIEESTGLEYQNDAGIHGDAPGTCLGVDTARILAANSDDPLKAIIVENDDETDAFSVPLGAATVGERLSFELILGLNADLYELAFDIVDAACGFSVFDPDADIYHPDRNVPEQPFEDRLGHESHDLSFGQPGSCNEDEWKFNLKHDRGAQMSDMYVEWSNGDYTYIAHDDTDTSQVSKYVTSYNTDHTISRIVVQAPLAWDGNLVIAHGPCDVVDAPVPQPPAKGTLSGNFTVVQPDEYVLIVTMVSGPSDLLGDLLPYVRCDDEVCIMHDQLAYDALLKGFGSS